MQKQVIVMSQRVEKKHSILFKSTDPKAAVTSLYLMREPTGNPNCSSIRITIEEV